MELCDILKDCEREGFASWSEARDAKTFMIIDGYLFAVVIVEIEGCEVDLVANERVGRVVKSICLSGDAPLVDWIPFGYTLDAFGEELSGRKGRKNEREETDQMVLAIAKEIERIFVKSDLCSQEVRSVRKLPSIVMRRFWP